MTSSHPRLSDRQVGVFIFSIFRDMTRNGPAAERKEFGD